MNLKVNKKAIVKQVKYPFIHCVVALQEVMYDREQVQRNLDDKWVDQIVANYDVLGNEYPVLNRRTDGTYSCLGGQHTIKSWLKQGYTHAECIVFVHKTIEEEAKIKKYRDYDRKLMNAFENFRNMITSGDELALLVVRELDENKISHPIRDLAHRRRGGAHNHYDINKNLVCLFDFAQRAKTAGKIETFPLFVRLLSQGWRIGGKANGHLQQEADNNTLLRGLWRFVSATVVPALQTLKVGRHPAQVLEAYEVSVIEFLRKNSAASFVERWQEHRVSEGLCHRSEGIHILINAEWEKFRVKSSKRRK